MIYKKLMTRTLLIGPVLAAMLGAGVLIGCTGDSGGEGAASGSEEGSGANLAPDETFDMVRGDARLILSYDAASNSFEGTVENTTNNVLNRVRIEVHLSNGTELGPTTPVHLAPGQTLPVTLPSTQASFTGWIAHAEVGSGGEGSRSGGEGGGEHGGSGEGSGGEGSGGEASGEGGGESGSESGGEGGSTGAEAGEAAMSSRSFLWDSRGTAFSGDWPSPPGTMRRPSLSTPPYRTRSRRCSAMCRPSLTSSRGRGQWESLAPTCWDI